MKKTGFNELFPVVVAVISASVIVHGVSSLPVSRLYKKSDANNIEGDSDKENEGESEEA